MPVIPANLFVQFVEQGVQKGLLANITKTLDGEHYYGERYLQDTLSALVQKHGRVDIEKLAEELCIEQASVKRAIDEIAAKNTWRVVDDLVLTQDYADNVTKEAQALVDEKGCISIVAQAQQMKLPYTLLKTIVDGLSQKEGYLRFSQIPDIIATKSYIDDCKTKILDELKTIDEPLPIFKLQKSQDIPEDMFYLLLEQIVKEETFTLGVLRGKRSRGTFEPSVYKERQLILIKSIFDSNECISYNTIESMYKFTDPDDLIADSYDKHSFLCLSSCIIKSSIKETAKEKVQSTATYCEVSSLLPVELASEDVNKMVDIILSEINAGANGSKKLINLDGGYVANSEYIQHLIVESNAYLRNLARNLKQKLSKNQTISSIGLGDKDIVKAFENLECPYVVAERLLPFTRTPMLSQFKDVLQTPFIESEPVVSGDQWINEQKLRELKKLSSLRQSIYFNYQAKKLFKDAATQKSLEKYILKGQCIEFLYHFVIYMVLDQSYNKTEVSESTSLYISLEDIENQNITDSKQQKCVISYFIRENDHRYDNTLVVEIEDLLKKKDLDQFVAKILVSDQQDLFKDQVLNSEQTKKTANEMTHTQLHNQLQQLTVSAQTIPQMLHLITLIIFQKQFQLPLYVSGKFVPMILSEVKPLLPEDEQQLLDIAHTSIVNNTREQHLDDYTKLKALGMKYTLY